MIMRLLISQTIGEYSRMLEIFVRPLRRTLSEARGVVVEQQQHVRHRQSTGTDTSR